MPDNKKTITEEDGIMQRIGNRADRSVGRRSDHRRIEVKVHLDDELRHIFHLRKCKRARWQRSWIVMDVVEHGLAHLRAGQRQPSIADPGKTRRHLRWVYLLLPQSRRYCA